MAKTVTFEIDTDLCELTVDSGTLFLGEQAPIVFAGYTPASGNTLFLSLFDKDHVTPLADNATSANTLDLRYEALRNAFGDCKAAHSFYATVIERTSGGSWVGQVLAAGHVRVEWSPVVFDAVSGNPATLKGATGATGAALTWDMLTDAQKASLKGADGANGATGATGPQGPQGPQGIQGVAGPQGAAGTNGTNGSDGADGVSPVVSVTDVIGGHKVTIVDASGTKEFTVLNGSTGAQGPQGVQGIQGLPGIQGEKGDTGDPSHALEGERMRNSPSQRQMILALKKVWTALGGTIVCLMLSLSCFAVNRDTEWQDVPPETRVGTVLDLGQGGVGGGTDTNAVQSIIQANVETNHLCTVAAAMAMTNGVPSVISNALPIVTNAYTKLETDAEIESNAHTNGGAKAYADTIMSMSNDKFLTYKIPAFETLGDYFQWVGVVLWVNGTIHFNSWNEVFSEQGNLSSYVTSTASTTSSSTSVTNGGAKAYADATFRTLADNVCHSDSHEMQTFGVPSGVTFNTDKFPSWNYVTGSWEWMDDNENLWFDTYGDHSAVNFTFEGEFGTPYESCTFYATKVKVATSGREFVTYDNVPSTNGLVTASVTNGLVTAAAATNAAEAVFSANADYALTNLTAATLSLRSGEIGNYVAPTNFTLALSFADNGRSGDCILYVENPHPFESEIAVEPTTFNLVASDLANALTLGKATTNIVTFTRVKANTILVGKVEVK